MGRIKVLGCWGSKGPQAGTTSFLVTPKVCIDAGNIMFALGEEAKEIEAIFLTHSHLDHIVDIPFLIDAFFEHRTIPLKIYGLKETLADLKEFILNWKIWPDFNEIRLINSEEMAITLHEVNFGERIFIDNVALTPIRTEHTVASCGYIIEKEGDAILFSSDTYICDNIWFTLNDNPHISSLIIDVSFPSRFKKLALDSKHLTPELLSFELLKLNRPIKLYINHLKQGYKKGITEELKALGILEYGKILHDGEEIEF